MSRKFKPTRYVRVRRDFVLEMAEEFLSTPFGGPDDAGDVLMAAARALHRKGGVVALCTPFSVQFGVDHRKRQDERRAADIVPKIEAPAEDPPR